MAGTWVRTGTVTVTNGSKKVTGNGTAWLSNLLQKVGKGCMCVIDNVISEVDYVNSDTELYLVEAWAGATASGKSYKIQVTVTDTIPELSSRISQSLAYANANYGNLESWTTGAAAVVTLTGPAGNQVTLPNLAAMNSGPGASPDFDLRSPAKLLRWQNYGQSHVIFDASLGKSPVNTDIDRDNPQLHVGDEAIHYPTLMGWNGSKTYGVRVDSARSADSVKDLSTAQIQPRTRSINTYAAAHYYLLGRFEPSGDGTFGTLHVRGYIGQWAGGKGHIDITVKNRGGVSVTGYGTGLVDIRVHDTGSGWHEVWVYLPPYYVAELEVFVVGTGVTGWLFGDVVTDMPNGIAVWSGAQSLPIMLTSNDQVSGFWDPIITGISDFHVKNASYIRVGKMVMVRAYISFIGMVVPSNDGVVYGLPFIPKDIGFFGYTPCSICIGKTSEPSINAYIPSNLAKIIINDPVTRAARQFESGADYMFSATYEIL